MLQCRSMKEKHIFLDSRVSLHYLVVLIFCQAYQFDRLMPLINAH